LRLFPIAGEHRTPEFVTLQRRVPGHARRTLQAHAGKAQKPVEQDSCFCERNLGPRAPVSSVAEAQIGAHDADPRRAIGVDRVRTLTDGRDVQIGLAKVEGEKLAVGNAAR
jgi:hypothetical protein